MGLGGRRSDCGGGGGGMAGAQGGGVGMRGDQGGGVRRGAGQGGGKGGDGRAARATMLGDGEALSVPGQPARAAAQASGRTSAFFTSAPQASGQRVPGRPGDGGAPPRLRRPESRKPAPPSAPVPAASASRRAGGRDGTGPISMRSTTDLDAEPDRSRAGSGPISTRSTTDLGDQSVQSPLTAVTAALTFTTAIGPVIAILELAALGIGG